MSIPIITYRPLFSLVKDLPVIVDCLRQIVKDQNSPGADKTGQNST